LAAPQARFIMPQNQGLMVEIMMKENATIQITIEKTLPPLQKEKRLAGALEWND